MLTIGGLKTINTSKFIQSLMATWLRRILLSSNDSSWNTLSHVDFRKLVSFGDRYAKRCALTLRNRFWIDVVNSWKTFLKCNAIDQVEDVLTAPIWLNSELYHGELLFHKTMP